MPPVDTPDSSESINKSVISSSKGLAEVTKGERPTVQFIHESVRDFLIKDKGLYQLWPEFGADWESQAHERMKLCCNAYVFHAAIGKAIDKEPATNTQNIKDSLLEQFPFLEYAGQFVLSHANDAAYRLTQQQFIREFPVSGWVRIFNILEKHKIRKYDQEADFLYILADRGLPNLIRTRLKITSGADRGGGRYRHPLLAAMAKGHKDSVIALLSLSSSTYKGIDITDGLKCKLDSVRKDHTPFSWACEEGYVAIARVLLQNGALVTEADLARVVKNGYSEVVKMLLDNGVDAATADKDGQSPLHLASLKDYAEIAKMLLDNGADIAAADKDGWTPLHVALRNGRSDIAKMLLDNGADIAATDKDGWTPLQLASRNGHSEIAKMLLDNGADIAATDKDGQTPLQLASRNGHSEISEVLLTFI